MQMDEPLEVVLDTIYQYEQSIGRFGDEAWVDADLCNGNASLDPVAEQMYRDYSKKCVDYLRYGYEIEACLLEDYPRYDDLMVRKCTPKIFQQCGFEDLPILHSQAHVRKELKPKDDYKHQHGLSIEQLKYVPEALESPIMLFDAPCPRDENNQVTGPGKGVIAILDCYDTDGIPLTAYFSPNGHGQYEAQNITCNFMTSIYGRSNLTRFINRAFEEGKILYVNQGKYECMKKDSLRFDEPQCSPAIENLYNIIQQSKHIVNCIPAYKQNNQSLSNKIKDVAPTTHSTSKVKTKPQIKERG